MRTPPSFPLVFISICFFAFLSQGCSSKNKITILSTANTSEWLFAENLHNRKIGVFSILKKAIENEKKPVIVLDMGNWLTGVPEGKVAKGRAIADCMNHTGYSLAAIGLKDLESRPLYLNKVLSKSKFQALASNIYLKNGNRPEYTEPGRIIKLPDTSIGFFSINIHNPQKIGTAKVLPFYRIEKGNFETARMLKKLKTNGAKITVMLLNANPINKKFRKKLYKNLAGGKLAPDIVIINGFPVKKHLKINRTHFIGMPDTKKTSLPEILKTQITLKAKTGELSGVSSKPIPLNKNNFERDFKIFKIETENIKTVLKIFDKKIGHSKDTLKKQGSPTSPLANWIALCLKKWSGATGAIITADMLRADLHQGAIRKKDIYGLMDYNIRIVYLKVRGDNLKTIIAKNLDKGLGLAGISLSMKGKNIEKIKIRNRHLIPYKIYQIAIPDYMLNNEKYSVLEHAVEFVNKPKSIIEILKWRLRRNNKVILYDSLRWNPPGEGRNNKLKRLVSKEARRPRKPITKPGKQRSQTGNSTSKN